MSAGVKAFNAEQAAAKETLSVTLDDIHDDACKIDEQCRYLVGEVMASIDEWAHDYGPEFLEAIGKIWGAAHRIRRSVERDDEPDSSAEAQQGAVLS